MTLQSGKIDQKEYLKRYLSGTSDVKKKKKKKKLATGIQTVKIIDDDIDLKNMRSIDNDELELYQLSEDAPIIAGVVDERPIAMQQADRYLNKQWKVITGGNEDDVEIRDINEIKSRKKLSNHRNNSDSDVSPPRKAKVIKKYGPNFPSSQKYRKSPDSDIMSPPRKTSKKSHQNSDSDISPSRKTNRKSRRDLDTDTSPPRKSGNKSRQDSNSNLSPPWRSSKQTSSSNKNDSRKRKDSDYDNSPRKSRNDKESNRKHGNNSPRITKDSKSSKYRSLENSDSDLSPPRKFKKDFKSNKYKLQDQSDSDLSPPRTSKNKSSQQHKTQDNSDSDLSPPRRKHNKSSGNHKKRNSGSDSDLSPPRKRSGNDNKMKKTLDGKMAGLQDAKQLVKENQEFKRREDEMFSKMNESVSGANASTVLRDRKTGRVRNLEEEAREAKRKEEKNSEHKEKYDKWGRGVKQGQDMQARLAQDLHEMAKPLARYRDDEDLEKDLKDTLRAEDPMLQYVLSKREKTEGDLKPKYKGSWAPNRFNIPPGYRWDGVDRSNGYEKQYFMNKNAKKAVEEEAYHWGVSDM